MIRFLRFPQVFLTGFVMGCLLTSLSAPRLLAQTITTVAGNGTKGFSGDGGPATQAKLMVINVAADRHGNLFLVDDEHQRIRKIAPDGIITTLAGSGNFGYDGDGKLATSASLRNPVAVAVDAQGSVFIADRENQRIRKVTPSGIMTTVAGNGKRGFSGDGGPATQAQMTSPRGIAVDAQGNLFFVDRENNRVRKVAPNGIISTVAGRGSYGYSGDGGPATSARLAYPSELALDAQGNLFIADEANFRVRKVTPGGIITTVAGNGTGGYSGDGKLATQATIGYPTGIAVDASGNLFIADSYNSLIRKVTPDGIITTLAGNGTEGFRGDGALAENAQLAYPAGVAVDGQGNLLIADSGNYRVRKVMADASPVSVGSVSLVNADTEQEIKPISEGETLNLAHLVTRNLNLRVNTGSTPVGSVRMVLSGQQSRTQTDNALPYALFGDNKGNFNAWTPSVGNYTLTITPYSGSGATGKAGAVYTVNFKVINQANTGPQVLSYSLINADLNTEIQVLTDGEPINVATLPTRNLNIRANTSPAPVGSVKLVLSGPQNRTQTDNGAPYALFGDRSGSFNAWTPTVGNYTLVGTPYSGPEASGQPGIPLTVRFQVINQTPQARTTTPADVEAEAVRVYPNPFRESFTLERGGKGQGQLPVVLYDANGRKEWEQVDAESKQLIQPGSTLAPGMYVLQVGEGKTARRVKVLKMP